jgi:multiple sugar transport system permease protein/raffinose/stachyose/melibiose transport system permease protein
MIVSARGAGLRPLPARRGLSQSQRRQLTCLLFVLPALTVVFVFFLFPMLRSLVYSFTNWDGIARSSRWIGLKNFQTVVADSSFRQVVFNTLYLMVIYVPVLNALALLLAVAVYNAGKAGNLYKSMLFFPNLLSMTVVALVWRIIYTYDGLLNRLLRAVGLKALVLDWLGNPGTVLPAMSLTIIWFAVGYYLLIYLAGLNTVPVEIYECAEVEGVNPVQRLFRITIPLIAPSITINTVLSTIGIITLFDLPFVLTRGGPGYLSETLALHVYFFAFVQLKAGYALALAVILGLFAVLITVVQLRLLRRREEALL